MKISMVEQAAIREAIFIGQRFGFGNIIAHLKSAWALTLVEDHGFTEAQAQEAAGGGGYPIAMHRDLLDRGEWDETGRRYRKDTHD